MLLAGASMFTFGKYKLLDLLGRGGGGSVFVAQHTTMNRRVALKIIPKQLGGDSALLERFLVEARAIAALDHPNIVHAYSLDNEGDRYYMVLELVEGRDLQRMVEADGPLDYSRAADYIRQAAEGLDHAHSRKMIHCDIKPSNLLVNPQGVVKILDLGMARLTGANAGQGETSGQEERMLGTVDYVAPEQAMRSPDLDHRVDIYALGATLYFLLTGHAPFPGGSLAEKILKHQTAEPRSILEERPGAPRDLVKICQKMMAKNPADRYQTAAEVASVLAAWRPPKKVLKAVALDDTGKDQEQDGAFDLAALTASRPTGLSKPGSGKALLGKSSSAGKRARQSPWPRNPARRPRRRLLGIAGRWCSGPADAVLALLGIVLGAMLMDASIRSLLWNRNRRRNPQRPHRPRPPRPLRRSPRSRSPRAMLDDLTIPELVPLNGGNKPKPPVKPPSKPAGDSRKPGEPVKVALVPPKELPQERPKHSQNDHRKSRPRHNPRNRPRKLAKASRRSPPNRRRNHPEAAAEAGDQVAVGRVAHGDRFAGRR